MIRNTSIKEFHRAKLRELRDAIARENNLHERKAQALRKAEQMELKWELEVIGVKPLKARR